MTTFASHHVPPGRSLAEGASPATIRAALSSGDHARFDDAYALALAQARQDYDLAPVHDMVEEWRRQAIAQSDPDAFRRMVRRAAEFFTGEPVPEDEPLATSRAKAGM